MSPTSHRSGLRVIAGLLLLVLQYSLQSCATTQIAYKAIYVDLDGTALDSTRTVRNATVDALREFRAHGGHVGIATGRTFEQASAAIRAIEPDLPVVLYNGSALHRGSSPGVELLAQLDPGVAAECVETLRSATGLVGAIQHFEERAVALVDSPTLRSFAARNSLTLSDSSAGHTIKVIAVFTDSASAGLAQRHLRQRLAGRASVVNSTGTVVEVLAPGSNKLTGVRRALEGTGITLRDVLAFGDGENDAEMLRGVGFGVAMCGCLPAACKAADVIIGSNSSDAIAQFVRRVVLQRLGRD